MIDRRQFGLLGLGLAASACGGSRARVSPGTARMAFGATIESLDPLLTINAYPLFRSIFDALTEIRADGSLGPRLARSWRANADATEWHFDLRDDARWSDGTPVTADDVRFTMETIRATTASLNRQYLADVVAVDVVAPQTIRFRLARPFAAWPRQMTLLSIVPAKTYSAAEFSRRPLGSGPYRVERWTPGAALDLAANPFHADGPFHAGGAAPLPHVSVLSIPDEGARLNALQSGDVDVITVTPQQIPLLARRPGIAVQTIDSNRVSYLGFVAAAGPLHDPRIRQAIDAAIDREAICRYLLHGAATPIGQLVAPSSFGYDPAIRPTAHDPARARALLAAAGYAGQPIVFQYPSNGAIPLAHLVAEAVQGCLGEVGITLEMRAMEQNNFIGDWLGNKLLGLYLFAFAPSTMDAGLVTGSLFGPTSGVDDPVIAALETLQQSQTDAAERAATFGRMWARNRQQAWYAPLFNDVYVYATARGVVTLEPRRDGYVTAHDLRPPLTDRKTRPS